MRIAPLTLGHVESAAALVARRYTALRQEVAHLPRPLEDSAVWVDRLSRLVGQYGGTAAFDGRSLVGFLSALPIGVFDGRPAMLSPEWGHAWTRSDAGRTQIALVAEALRVWASEGMETFLICAMAHDTAAIERWTGLGFGHRVCDAVRGLDPIEPPASAATVRRAREDDAPLLATFDRQLRAHLEGSPVFLPPHKAKGDAEWGEQLADPTGAVWIAEWQARAVGFLVHGPASGDACDLISDSCTSSITGMYVIPDARGAGIATALLAQAVAWAHEQGKLRLAVDFETANASAARFWLRHFRPVVLSVSRTLGARPHGADSPPVPRLSFAGRSPSPQTHERERPPVASPSRICDDRTS